MQLYAFNDQKRLISAKQATRQHNYSCFECGGIVRLRSGIYRQPHFFHLESIHPCRLSRKSMEHLQAQCLLFRAIPSGDGALEYRFPEINRVADVVWFSRKLVFEIQCSPMAAREAEARNRDYASLGFHVVWILHDSQFNQKKPSAVELLIRSTTHYFTNISPDGKGYIYDQFDIITNGKRRAIISPFVIDFSQPLYLGKDRDIVGKFPRLIQMRLRKWTMHFSGDLLHLSLTQDLTKIEEMIQAEIALERYWKLKWSTSLISRLLFGICRSYRLLFQIFLEKACQ